jgi:hypothetical protein
MIINNNKDVEKEEKRSFIRLDIAVAPRYPFSWYYGSDSCSEQQQHSPLSSSQAAELRERDLVLGWTDPDDRERLRGERQQDGS